MNSTGKHGTFMRVLLPAVIAVATLAVYWNVTGFSFINFDDDLYIYNNAMTLRGLTPETISWALTSLEVYNWHPMAWLSHMLDVQMFGLDAGLHHLTSVIIHICNSVLLFFVFYKTTDAPWKSAFVAAMFALHPMHVESVAWVSERKDVLSLFFMLLATATYIRYVRVRDIATYVLLLLLFVFALMSKPIAVVFPLLLFAFDIWPLKRVRFRQAANREDAASSLAGGWKTAIVEKLPLLALSLAGGIVTIIAQGRGGAISDVETLSIWGRITHAGISYVQYLGKMFFPADLSFYYLYESNVSAVSIALAFLLLAGISVYAVYSSGRKPYILAGWLIYLIALLPVIGLLQAGAQSIADRYTYIPLNGIAVMLAWGVPELLARFTALRYVPLALGILATVAVGVRTYAQVQTWANNVALYTHAISVNPENSLAYNNLGTHYLAMDELDSARKYFSGAVEVNPKYAMPHYNLGLVEQLAGNTRAASTHYLDAVRLNPRHADAYLNLGVAYSDLGLYEEAIDAFRRTSELTPQSANVHYHLGVLHFRRGDLGKAATQLRGAIDLNPLACEPYLAYARVLAAQGNTRGANLILARAKKIGCSDSAIQEVRDEFGKQGQADAEGEEEQ